MKRIKRTFKIVLVLILAFILGNAFYIINDGLTDENKQADIAVILGNKVNKDGTLSIRLEERMKCGLNLYEKGRVNRILVSGGLGKEGFYEGTKMKDYLVLNGVPDSLIIVDNFGNNTRATVENTLKLKDSLNYKSIIVVSQYFHLTRTKKLFKKKNFTNISSVSPKYFEARDIYSILREIPAYYLQ